MWGDGQWQRDRWRGGQQKTLCPERRAGVGRRGVGCRGCGRRGVACLEEVRRKWCVGGLQHLLR